jgi:hypothetical protein
MPRCLELGALTARAPRTPWPVCLAVALGFLVYLIPLHDVSLRPSPGGPVDPARGIPLARYLEADHELTTARSGIPAAPLPAVAPGRTAAPAASASTERLVAESVASRPRRDALGPDVPRSPPAR